ncbi:MAG: periplasmic heavy metal sensor [Pseudomonadota bacterium]
MKSRTLIILLVVSGVLNLTFIGLTAFRLLARPDRPFMPPHGPPHEGPGPMDFAKQLGLDGARLEKFKAIKKQFREEKEKTQEDMQKLHEELFTEMRKDAPDMQKIDGLIDDVSERQKTMQKSIMHKIIAERTLLADDQKAEFDKIMKKKFMKHHFGYKNGKGMGKGKPPH